MYPKGKLILWALFVTTEGVLVLTLLPPALVVAGFEGLTAQSARSAVTAAWNGLAISSVLLVLCSVMVALLWPSRIWPRSGQPVSR